jgi:SAM-dependent methyltransferase
MSLHAEEGPVAGADRANERGSKVFGEDYFNRGHFLTRPQVWLSLRARETMYAIWCKEAGGLRGRAVLDFGTTPDTSRADSNCFIRWLLRDGAKVSLVSVEDISHLAEVFPGVEVLPRLARAAEHGSPAGVAVDSGQFDWVCSSAVLEHVGSAQNQREHLRECGRVAGGFFLTTPARDHWLEFHTKLPLLHWLPRERHRRVLRWLGHENWSREDWLRLVSADELMSLADAALGNSHDLTLHKVRALGATSNLVLIGRRKFPNRTRKAGSEP